MTTSALVPGLLPVAINGRPYLAEPTYERETVQVIRQQSDTSTEPGEQSLTPLGLWRRSQESWHHGAGQDFLDGRSEEAADPHRFRASKGVDVWTRGQVSLLNSTLKVWSSANTNLAVISSGIQLVLADGTEVYNASYPINLVPFNSSTFEAGTVGTWTAGAGTLIAASATWTARFSGYSLRITSDGSTNPSATTPTGVSGIPVTAGRVYRYAAVVNRDAASAARFWTFSITWYTAAGATISTTSEVSSVNDNVATEIGNIDLTAPATAAFASLGLQVNGTVAVGEIHYVDDVLLYPEEPGGSTFSTTTTWRSLGTAATGYINAGQAAQTVQSIATNGLHVWAALGTSGIHRAVLGGTISAATADVPAAPAGGQIHLVRYTAPFLMAAGSTTSTTGKNTLWQVSTPLGTPALSLIMTHDNASFEWVGIAKGRNVVYAWGNTGSNGEIYKITFDPNTGVLSTAASLATFLPDGETIHSLYFYAGGVILGTGKGLRLGQADGAGNIDYGPLVETARPVRCLEPQSRWCWFGMTMYDATSGGLGRVDLGYFTGTLTPAWASDLMATTQADITTAATWSSIFTSAIFPEKRLFTVSGVGLFVEDVGVKVASGTLETGTIRFSTSEPKTVRSLDVRHHALPAGGSVAAELQRESSGTWTSVGSSSTAASYGPATPLDLQDLNAEAMEFRLTLNRATAISTSPELTRWTAKVLPLPSTIDETFTLTLLMHETIDTTAADGQPYHMDVQAEIALIKTLEQARTIIEFQVGDETFEGYVVGSKFTGTHWNGPKREYAEGKLAVTLQTLRG